MKISEVHGQSLPTLSIWHLHSPFTRFCSGSTPTGRRHSRLQNIDICTTFSEAEFLLRVTNLHRWWRSSWWSWWLPYTTLKISDRPFVNLRRNSDWVFHNSELESLGVHNMRKMRCEWGGTGTVSVKKFPGVRSPQNSFLAQIQLVCDGRWLHFYKLVRVVYVNGIGHSVLDLVLVLFCFVLWFF